MLSKVMKRLEDQKSHLCNHACGLLLTGKKAKANLTENKPLKRYLPLADIQDKKKKYMTDKERMKKQRGKNDCAVQATSFIHTEKAT